MYANSKHRKHRERSTPIYDYQPKIKSLTCPSTPLLGDAWTGGFPFIPPGAPSPGFANGDNFPPGPGFLNAEVDGANLIGVPTDGPCERWTRERELSG